MVVVLILLGLHCLHIGVYRAIHFRSFSSFSSILRRLKSDSETPRYRATVESYCRCERTYLCWPIYLLGSSWIWLMVADIRHCDRSVILLWSVGLSPLVSWCLSYINISNTNIYIYIHNHGIFIFHIFLIWLCITYIYIYYFLYIFYILTIQTTAFLITSAPNSGALPMDSFRIPVLGGPFGMIKNQALKNIDHRRCSNHLCKAIHNQIL